MLLFNCEIIDAEIKGGRGVLDIISTHRDRLVLFYNHGTRLELSIPT